MGLFIITGTMGGGKSYFAAELAFKCWKAGGVVHSNVPWSQDELHKREFDHLHVKLPDDVSRWVRKEPSPEGGERLASDVIVGGSEGAENLIIVDEAALAFHMYDQVANRNRNRTIFELVVMSRQIGVDMYFISQSAANIDVAIRNVAEAVIHCVNVKRLPGFGPILAWFVGDFRRAWLSPLKRQVMSANYARFSPTVSALYHTHGVGAKINVARSTSRKEKGFSLSMSAWAFLAVLASLIVASFYFYAKNKGFWNIERRFAKAEKEDLQPVDLRNAPAPAGAAGPRAQIVAKLSAPLTFYTSDGEVFSMVQRPGVRLITMAEESTESVIVHAGAETLTFDKPKLAK